MIIASGMTTARDFMHNSGAKMGGGEGWRQRKNADAGLPAKWLWVVVN